MSSPSRILKLACPILAVAIIVLGLHAFQHESLVPVRQRFAEIKLWDSIPDRGFLCEGYDSGTKQEAMGVLGEFGQRDCSMCAASPELCASIGEKQLTKSQAYFGTGDRMKRFLAKAKSGEGFNVGVIGGSVSHGHGLSDLRGDKLSHLLIFEHLDKLFPAREGSSIGSYEPGKNSFINGAVPAMGSDYYAWCFPSHIPPDTDLVLLELGVNDELQIQRLDSYEMLLRGLLDLPNSPAILALHVPALSFSQIALGGDVHFGPAQFYDVPMLSMRNAIMDDIFANHSLTDYYFAHNKIGTDTRHIGPIGHRLLGELGTAYINSQLCEMDRSGMSGLAAEDIPVPPVPRMRLMSKYDADTVIPSLTPFCRSANAHGDFKLTPTKVDGWREFENNDKHFLIADVPGSTVQFEFTTTLGSVDIGYLRSRVYGLGNAECWVDDDRAKAVTLKGYWGHDVNIAQRLTIRSDLKPGSYVVHCELLDKTDDPSGAKEFRLISLMRELVGAGSPWPISGDKQR